jgi:hypothetical protein
MDWVFFEFFVFSDADGDFRVAFDQGVSLATAAEGQVATVVEFTAGFVESRCKCHVVHFVVFYRGNAGHKRAKVPDLLLYKAF